MDNSRDASENESKPSVTSISVQDSISGDGFWSLLQKEKGVEIPPYIKNILTFNNLDNPLSFQCIDDSAIAELEEFARTAMKDFFKKTENLEKYYGVYHKMPTKFRFLIGDRFLIKKLVDHVKHKPEDYWKGRTGTLPFNQVYIKGDIISESEEEPEDEPKKIEPPNRQKEKEELIRSIQNSMSRDLKNYPDFLAMVENISVKVQIKKDLDKQYNEEYFVSSGFVKCMICSVKITIRKHYLPKSGRKPRWVLSNFRRHVKSHLKVKGKPVDSPSEDDHEYQDMEVYKDDDTAIDNTEENENQEEEDQNEVSYTVTW